MSGRVLNIVTGPSGAGKSSFCRDQPDWQYNLHNLDETVRLNFGPDFIDDASMRDAAWQQMVVAILADIQAGRTPVTIDHVFDSEAIDALLGQARAAGYTVRTWVVSTESPDLCVARVVQRAAEGGHGWDPTLVEQIYDGALYDASELSVLSDVTYLIDNTGIDGFVPVAQIEEFIPRVRCEQVPAWARERFLADSAPGLERLSDTSPAI